MADIHFRILGYITTLALHVTSLAVLHVMKKEELSVDVHIKMLRGTLYRYFTCWTIMLQILYAALGLYCDVSILKNSNNANNLLLTPFKEIINILFPSLVWPCTMVVFTVFWSLFLYDRSLIFSDFIDQIVNPTSIHILHTIIVPIALWEMVFRPRIQPKSHSRNLVQLTVHLVIYLSMLYYTYVKEGIWLYPIFKVTFGSIHFALLHVYLAILFISFYYMQWFLNYLIHGSPVKCRTK